MPVTPLLARCGHCGGEELLSRIADGSGTCPFCQLSFCDNDVVLFLRDAFRADVAYRLLIRSLGQLAAPCVHLQVLPEPLLAGLAAEVLEGPVLR